MGITPFLSPDDGAEDEGQKGPGAMTTAILGALRAWGQRGGLQPVPGAGQPPPQPGSTRGPLPTDRNGVPLNSAPAVLDSPNEGLQRQADAQRMLGILPDPNAPQGPAGPGGGGGQGGPPGMMAKPPPRTGVPTKKSDIL